MPILYRLCKGTDIVHQRRLVDQLWAYKGSPAAPADNVAFYAYFNAETLICTVVMADVEWLMQYAPIRIRPRHLPPPVRRREDDDDGSNQQVRWWMYLLRICHLRYRSPDVRALDLKGQALFVGDIFGPLDLAVRPAFHAHALPRQPFRLMGAAHPLAGRGKA